MRATQLPYAQRMAERGPSNPAGDPPVEVRQLRALVAVAEEGTFTDAAIALTTSQASVSRLVASLERRLQVRLVDRLPRGARLTEQGEVVAARARRVLAEVDAITRIGAGADGAAEVRVGYAWAALGQHTTSVQRRWATQHPGSALVFVQVNTPTAGLLERSADVAVTRRRLDGRRFATALVGTESRWAALPSDHRLARRRSVRLADFVEETVAVDARTGTTTQDLWPAQAAPTTMRETHSSDEWLTCIAAGQAVGLTSHATTFQHPRPGVVYRPVTDAEPVPVWLAWWRDGPARWTDDLVHLVTESYRRDH